MAIEEELMFWDRVSIDIVNVRHGLLFRQQAEMLLDNSCFLFVVGRNGRITIDHDPYRFQSNCLVHVRANRSVTIECDSEEAEYYFVAYRTELLPNAGRKTLSHYPGRDVLQMDRLFRSADPVSLSEQFITLTNAWSSRDPLSRIRIRECFYTILYQFYEEQGSGKKRSVQRDTFAYARQYLRDHYANPVTIQSLSERLGVSRSTLHEQFTSRLGLSPQQYLMQLRLEAACHALETSQMSIDEIAASCGLRDKSYFSKVFKGRFGMPPGAFRKVNKSGNGNGGGYLDVKPSLSAGSEKSYTVVENMGRMRRYYEIPQRIVCLNYSSAEICAALGMSDRIVALASAEEALTDCSEPYRAEISKAPILPGRSTDQNVPGFETVCACRPDIVIGTGYSFDAYEGVADTEAFEAKGIHTYALQATYMLGCGFQSVYEDIIHLGRIFGRENEALEITEKMRRSEAALKKKAQAAGKGIRVFSFDAAFMDKVITCGRCERSLTNLFYFHEINAVTSWENCQASRFPGLFPYSRKKVWHIR